MFVCFALLGPNPGGWAMVRAPLPKPNPLTTMHDQRLKKRRSLRRFAPASAFALLLRLQFPLHFFSFRRTPSSNSNRSRRLAGRHEQHRVVSPSLPLPRTSLFCLGWDQMVIIAQPKLKPLLSSPLLLQRLPLQAAPHRRLIRRQVLPPPPVRCKPPPLFFPSLFVMS